MAAYLVRRFLLMLLTLFGISVIIFALLRIVPGNIVDILFDAAGFVNPAEKAKIEADLGLDKPIPVQYAAWIGGLVHGDLGYSYVSEKPALDEILPRIPITARLAGLALVFSILFGVPLGVISAVRQNTRPGLCAAGRQPERAVDAGVLARPADPDGVRRRHRHASRSTAPTPEPFWPDSLLMYSGAGRRGRLPQLGADHAADALVDAGGAAPGLHPHRALQGRLRRRRSTTTTRCATRCCRSSPSSASRRRS